MAKAVKVKKVKEVVEEPKVELPVEPIAETTIEEPMAGDEPPSVTLEEVKEVEKDVVKEVMPEPKKEVVFTLQPEVIETIFKGEPQPYKIIENEELSIEQKITNYLNDKEGELKINDFLKSLFGLPKFNEPAQWLLQGNSKYLRSVLEGMQAKGEIKIKNNAHRLLGQFYYPDSTTGIQKHHNLNTVDVVIKK